MKPCSKFLQRLWKADIVYINEVKATPDDLAELSVKLHNDQDTVMGAHSQIGLGKIYQMHVQTV